MDRDELLKACATVDVSAWSDALDEFGIAGVMTGIQKRSGSGRTAGFAVTARHETGRLGDYQKGDFGVGKLIAETGPGRILLVDMGGAPISTIGGLASFAAKARNASGVIVDGGCRDLDEIQATGLWLASRWVVPTTGKRRVKLTGIGQRIKVGGIEVSQGDLVVGDDTGIAVIPAADIERVLAKALDVVGVDREVEKLLHQGQSFAEASANAGYLPPATDK